MQYNILKSPSNLTGKFKEAPGSQQIGSITKELPCILLSAPADFIRFSCPADTAHGIWVLELEELHSKKDASFAYEILINDTPVYMRTMEPLSTTICPFFLKLALQPKDTITLRSCCSVPIRFSNIYLHSDLAAIEKEYLEPMEIGLCFPRFTCTDRETDLALMCKIRDDFSDLKHFTLGIGIEIMYMLLNEAELAERFRYMLGLAEETGVNVIFNFNSWWDGTPMGRDGKGGYFGDMEYQQVVYDPITGRKMLSIPNIWRNTPWYTMNHDHLNMVRKARLASTMDILARETAKLRCQKGQVPNVRLFIDNEPTYWAEFAYSSSPESGGDYNEHTIAAAKKDGIDLEPHGLPTHEQKCWLVHNLSLYMTDISEAYHACSSREYAAVTGGITAYSDHFLTENTFSHTMAYSRYPYADGHHMLYEEHVNPWTRLGVECDGHQDERVLSYMNGTGRYAQVNAERCCYTDSKFHHQFYAHGAVCDIIFNYFYDTDIEQLHLLDKMDGICTEEPVFGTPVMSYRSYDQLLTGGEIISMDNMEIAPLRDRRVLRPMKSGEGSVTFSIGTLDDFPDGGWVELTGLVRPQNGEMRVSIGTSPTEFDISMILPERDADYQILPFCISLADILEANKDTPLNQTLYLRLDSQMLYYDDWAQMNAIWQIRSVAAFPAVSVPAVLPITLTESRALALMTAYRRDCSRLLVEYDFLKGTSEEDNYKTFYQKLLHRISVQNTDKFVIQGTGFLEKYNLYVDSGDAAITLTLALKDDILCASLNGKAGSQLTLQMDGYQLQAAPLSEDRSCLFREECVKVSWINCYQISCTKQADTPKMDLAVLAATKKISEGRLSAHTTTGALILTVEENEALSRTFSGTFAEYDGEKKQIAVITHDGPSWNWQPTLYFNCDETVPVTIEASAITGNMLDHISTNPYTPAAILNARIDACPTLDSLNRGDAVSLTLQGETVTAIHATRGLARGKIVEVMDASLTAPMHNPYITIETAPGTQATFELGMGTHLNYKRAHAENPLLAIGCDLELKENNIVLISFEPETAEGRPYRALEITMI